MKCSGSLGSTPSGASLAVACEAGELIVTEPAALPNGERCASDAECSSGVCDGFDEICCDRICDPVQEFCDASQCGTCQFIQDGAPPPEFCTFGSQCASGFCVDGVCCEVPSCPEGEVCGGRTATCAPGLPNGSPCGRPEECGSGFCTDGTFCRLGTGLGCFGPPPRDRCEEDRDCTTGVCAN